MFDTLIFWKTVWKALGSDLAGWLDVKAAIVGAILWVLVLLYRLRSERNVSVGAYFQEGFVSLVLTVAAVFIGISIAALLYYPSVVYTDALHKKDEADNRAEKALADLASERERSLVGQIDDIVIGTVTDRHDVFVGTHIALNISVRNRGRPSYAVGYRLSIPGLGIVDAIPTTITEPIRLDVRGQEIVLTPEDQIYDKTINPVLEGSLVPGWARYFIDGVRAEQLLGQRLEVRFKDVNDRIHSIVIEELALDLERAKQRFYVPKPRS